MIIPGTLSVEKIVYFPKDSILIRWKSINFEAKFRIIVRFRRVGILMDRTLDTFVVLATTDWHSYNVLFALEAYNYDKYYYFEFDCMFIYSFLNTRYFK